MRVPGKCVLCIGLVLGLWINGYARGQVAGVVSSDCVKVKYITGLWMSTGGIHVAYLVKAPNVEKNRNDYRLFVKDIEDKTVSPGKLLLTGVDISDIQWLGDDRRIAILVSIGGIKKVVLVNVSTGAQEPLLEMEANIDSYSVDSTGSTIAYGIVDSQSQGHDPPVSNEEKIANGYRVDFGERASDGEETESIYIRHRDANGHWSPPNVVAIENPFTHRKTTHLIYPRYLTLSPNGKRLFLAYSTNGIPEEWKQNPFINFVTAVNSLTEVMVLYDVDNRSTKLALKTTNSYSKPRWSSDSRSFFVNTHSPIGSSWEAEDIRDHQTSVKDVNMFKVNAETGEVAEVLRRVPSINYHDGPLFLLPDGDVVVRTAGTSVARLHRFKESWQEVEHVAVPQNEEDRFYLLTSNGSEIMGVHEGVTTPQNLFAYQRGQGQIRLVTDLNPQLRAVRFAAVETVGWTTAEGLNVRGLLFMPPDYIHGRRYPLVIQTKGDSGWFTCDSGVNHYPSFAPQPIASAGIMYLARSFDEDWNVQEDLDKRPKGYPGGIAEAVQQMNIWDSAIDMLDKRGMIDPSKVGIIGFSRTGWQVEFDLVHSNVRYAAATAADNVQYSLSDYWLLPGGAHDAENMYGGPPYGETRKNWKKYSISFNLEKVHTPLLMEEMGNNIRDDVSDVVPRNLAIRYEITKGLGQLGKPVELYYYPLEDHAMDHPKARLATMQRNVDWYRFWLQGYEDGDPSKKEQYERWHVLKRLHAQDIKSADHTQ